jgi:hypothetical protein
MTKGHMEMGIALMLCILAALVGTAVAASTLLTMRESEERTIR